MNTVNRDGYMNTNMSQEKSSTADIEACRYGHLIVKTRIHHQHLISGRGMVGTAIGCKGSILNDNQQIYFTNIWRSKKLDLYLRRQKR